MSPQKHDKKDRRRKPNGQFDNEHATPQRRPDPFAQLEIIWAYQWRRCGFAPEEAAQWHRNFSTKPDKAAKWRDAGFGDSHTANSWRKAGFAPDEAAEWSKTVVDPRSAYNLHKSGFVPGEEWEAVGISPDEAERWNNRFWYTIAVEWHEQGFTPEEADEWMKHGFDPEDAVEWLAYDFGPEEAAEWILNSIYDDDDDDDDEDAQ